MAYRSWGASEAVDAYNRALELSMKSEDTYQVLLAMYMKQCEHTPRCEHKRALEMAEKVYSITQHMEEPLHKLLGHQMMCLTNMFYGNLATSLHHGEQALLYYDFDQHHSLAYECGQDPAIAVMIFSIYDLWYLGFPDRAIQLSHKVNKDAKRVNHPFTDFFRLTFQTRLHRWRREVEKTQEYAELLMDNGREYQFQIGEACSMVEMAWVLGQRGHPDEAIPMLERAIVLWRDTGMLIHDPEFYGILAELYAQIGKPAYGLELLDDAIISMEKGSEWYHEAEVYRIRGDLLLLEDKNNIEAAEKAYIKSVSAAKRLKAKSCELRTAMNIYKMWQKHGHTKKLHDAYTHLESIYDWFTEGFDTCDLLEAKAIISSHQT
jgi:adenylate cyclase